jgi:hypothetical protein
VTLHAGIYSFVNKPEQQCFLFKKKGAQENADLAADFLASQVLVLEVALQDVLLCRQHDSSDPHPELLQNMLGSHHLQLLSLLTAAAAVQQARLHA